MSRVFYMLFVFFCTCLLECRLWSYAVLSIFFFQAEDGIRYLVRSRGLGDVYKRQGLYRSLLNNMVEGVANGYAKDLEVVGVGFRAANTCLLYTSDAADERSSVDLGGRRILKKKRKKKNNK